MSLQDRVICEDQSQALNTYLNALLSLPQQMSALPEAAAEQRSIPAVALPGAHFKCFVFTVAGLKLALPQARVTELVEFSECGGTAVPPLVLGSLAYENQQVPVLDSVRVILPDSNATPAYRWLVIVDHGSYALACDSVEPGMEVAQDAVCWRTHLTKRRWLAGTLLQQRCALLDADEIYE